MGTHTITATAIDSGGLTGSDTITVTVGAGNSAPTAAYGSSCAGLTCDFTDGSSDGDGSVVSWLWNFGDGSASSLQNPSRSYAAGGTYTVTLTATDNGGASDTASQSLTVVPANQAPLAALTFSCTGLTCDFSAASSGGDGAVVSWAWDFGDGNASSLQNPGHSYAAGGSYAVTLTVTDDAGAAGTASQSLTVAAPNQAPAIFQTRISASSDDAEERASGKVKLTSSDLELVFDRDGDQTVGLRFNAVTIPAGATILDAAVQFETDEPNTVATALTIQGENTDDAATFAAISGNITSRPRTLAAVAWSPAAWPTKHEAGLDQLTPNIAAVIQEIVDRPGWSSGNSLAVLISGTGERTAESFDGRQSTGAPLLHVEYVLPGS